MINQSAFLNDFNKSQLSPCMKLIKVDKIAPLGNREKKMKLMTIDVSQFTHHLQVGDPMFPPQVFLEFWSHSRKHIVEIHDDVYK